MRTIERKEGKIMLHATYDEWRTILVLGITISEDKIIQVKITKGSDPLEPLWNENVKESTIAFVKNEIKRMVEEDPDSQQKVSEEELLIIYRLIRSINYNDIYDW